MTKPMITIHNAATGEIIQREMNEQEIEQSIMDAKAMDEQKNKNLQKATEKAALLAKLGITDDEAKLLLS